MDTEAKNGRWKVDDKTRVINNQKNKNKLYTRITSGMKQNTMGRQGLTNETQVNVETGQENRKREEVEGKLWHTTN